MPLSVPLALVALGGAALLILRDERAALAALMLQWLGLAWVGAESSLPSAGGAVGLNQGSAAELVTAVTCGVVLAITLRNLRRARTCYPANSPAPPRPGLTDYLLPGAVTLLGGVAGLGFASLFPIGLSAQNSLACYWAALASALALVLDGARNPVKLAAGLLGLLNAASLLALALSPTALSPAALGLMAAVRVAMAALFAYGWALLQALYGDLSLEPLFASRDEATTRELALLGVEPQGMLAQAQPPTPNPQEESPAQ